MDEWRIEWKYQIGLKCLILAMISNPKTIIKVEPWVEDKQEYHNADHNFFCILIICTSVIA